MDRKEVKLNSKDMSGINIMPNKLYDNICNIMENRLNDINDNIEIARKYNPGNMEKYKYYKEAYEIFMKDINENLQCNTFWQNSMDYGHCDYIMKSNKNVICNKKINIEVFNKYGKWRCAKHVSKLHYEPSCNTRNKDNLCISISIRNNESCELPKQYGDYCIYHYANSIGISSLTQAKDYYFECLSLSAIDIE